MMRSRLDDGQCGDERILEQHPDAIEMELSQAVEKQARVPRRQRPRHGKRRQSNGRSDTRRSNLTNALLYATLAQSLPPTAMAQGCISLRASTVCSAFNASSISTNANMTALFPFLSSVTDTASFDSGLLSYIAGDFASVKYKSLLGCSDFHTDNTTDFYARYTASVLCNAIVQNSLSTCSLTGMAARPLCAESCAEYAESEEEISASNVCGTAGSGALMQIRADFTNCALPADSLTQSCILAADNQPNNCGYGPNLSGLCSYCAASSPIATDSCCVFSDSTSRCKGVSLPIVATSALRPITTTASHTTPASSTSPTSSTSPSSTSTANSHRGLTGGQVAGIVVGAILGALVLLGLLILGCLCLKRHRDSSPPTSVFNQPVTARHNRQQPEMSYGDSARDANERAGLAVLPGARVARMAALEDSDDAHHRRGASYSSGGAYRRKSTSLGSTPESRSLRTAPGTGTGGPQQAPNKRGGSLSSGSQLGTLSAAAATATGFETSSPSSNDYTSPESATGGGAHSEQLAFFKDYYSTDDIHSGDLVSTLWAYEPRAADEFQLERGDMIKVLGIWDDGWATGVRVRGRAEEWRAPGAVQRDSGLGGNLQQGLQQQMGDDGGEVKAFPLVCVCLPQHWRKTIEGESTEGSGSGPGSGGY